MDRFLTGLHITNYRGFRSFTCVGLKPITIFGGMNNCGKSTLLEALYFLSARSLAVTPAGLAADRGLYRKDGRLSSLFYGDVDGGEIIIHGTFSDETACGLDFENTLRSAGDFGIVDESEAGIGMDAEGGGISAHAPVYVLQYYTDKNAGSVRRGSLLITSENGEYRVYPMTPKTEGSEYAEVSGREYDDDWRCTLYQSQRRRSFKAVYGELFKSGKDSEILDVLRGVDARVRGVAFDGEDLLVDVGVGRGRLPIGVMGDGLVKATQIMALMAQSPRGGMVCIDEIENGLHYSAMAAFWRGLLKYARQNLIQLIATTHNLEMIQSLADELGDDAKEDFAYFNLARTPKDEVVATPFSLGEVKAHLDSGVEMR